LAVTLIVSLLLVGALGVAVIAAVAFAGRGQPSRHRSRWARAGYPVAACIGCGLLGLVLIDWVHSSPIVQNASAATATCTSQPGATVENMAHLFIQVSRTYGSSGPVHLAPVGDVEDNTVLVMIPGQVTNHMWSAVRAGLGVTGDARAEEVRGLIEDYRRSNGLPAGTTVILAGHSYGGIIAQLVADNPHATDFQVGAVVTWGAPSVSNHKSGVAYQQYFSEYDVVPMFSTFELALPVILGGLIGGVSDLAAMQFIPTLKGMHTGQTYVPDMGQYWRPTDWIHWNGTWNDAHDGYGQSRWLATRTLAYTKGGGECALLTPSE
jgi:pimeloyl-ACP methyl ester carboxylesterase